MAALNPNNTQRWFYTYENSLHHHEMMVRGDAEATLADADGLIADLLTAIGARFVASVITGVEHSAIGSDLRFPVASDRIADDFGSGAAIPVTDAREAVWTGRSTGGRRTRFGIFGWSGDPGDFRQTTAEDSAVGAVADLFSVDSTVMVGIDLFPAIWHQYANIKTNDHWVRRSRI